MKVFETEKLELLSSRVLREGCWKLPGGSECVASDSENVRRRNKVYLKSIAYLQIAEILQKCNSKCRLSCWSSREFSENPISRLKLRLAAHRHGHLSFLFHFTADTFRRAHGFLPKLTKSHRNLRFMFDGSFYTVDFSLLVSAFRCLLERPAVSDVTLMPLASFVPSSVQP